MKTILFTGIVFCSSVIFAMFNAPARSTSSVSVEIDQQESEPPNIRTKARELFMRGKLASNQKIVEGLTTKNFDLISEGALEVKLLVKGQHWFVIAEPEYKRYSKEMEFAAGKLQTAAKQKNMDAAALRYFDLTMNCLDCHRYIETQKY